MANGGVMWNFSGVDFRHRRQNHTDLICYQRRSWGVNLRHRWRKITNMK